MHLSCPLCREKVELRVVAYRRRSLRIECRKCELRFSIDFGSFANALMDTDGEDVPTADKRVLFPT
jgi:transposase-like protein